MIGELCALKVSDIDLDKQLIHISKRTQRIKNDEEGSKTVYDIYEVEWPILRDITIPKVFDSMGFGTFAGILFFLLVLFAAVTSSIALTESAVSTVEDELKWSRKKSTVIVGFIMIILGTLSCLGYGPLSFVKIIGMQFLDFFDFLTNSVMMPIAALMTSLFVSKVVGVDRMEEEIRHGESKFRRKKIFVVMIKYLCPIFAMIILASSVATAFGWISM